MKAVSEIKVLLPAQYPIGKCNTSTRVERGPMKAEVTTPASVKGEPRLKQHQHASKYKNIQSKVQLSYKSYFRNFGKM